MRVLLQADLRLALKRRETVEIATLRCLIGAVDNAGAVTPPPRSLRAIGGSLHVATGSGGGPTEVARRRLSEAEVAALLRKEWEFRRDAALELDRLGRAAQADVSRAEMAVVQRYLAATESGSASLNLT